MLESLIFEISQRKSVKLPRTNVTKVLVF